MKKYSLLGNSFSLCLFALIESPSRPGCLTIPTMVESLAFHKKRRAVVRTSITKLETKLADLESVRDSPTLHCWRTCGAWLTN